MRTDDKALFRGVVGWFGYLIIVMVVLFAPAVSNQPFIQKLFPLPLPNGNASYYEFVIFFGWIIGIPVATWWFLIRPLKQFSQSAGFHRGR